MHATTSIISKYSIASLYFKIINKWLLKSHELFHCSHFVSHLGIKRNTQKPNIYTKYCPILIVHC